MKLKTTLALILLFGSNAAFAQVVTRAKAAELSLHRLERLSILKKIDGTFEIQMAGLTLETIDHSGAQDPSFKSTIMQFAGADGTRKTLDIIMEEDGKPLSFNTGTGADAVGFPVWPDKDAVTLCENSLHYILDNAPVKPELAPFDSNLKSLSIADGKNAKGERVATIEIQTTDEQKLNILLKLDGTIDSASVVPR